MSISRKQLHDLLDSVSTSEYDLVYRLLIKLVEEDEPTADEINSIRKGREEFHRGEFVNFNDVKWD